MSIFDLEDGDFIFGSGDTGFDSDGHMMNRMSDNMAFDLDTGEIHMVSGWDDDDEDDWQKKTNVWLGGCKKSP